MTRSREDDFDVALNGLVHDAKFVLDAIHDEQSRQRAMRVCDVLKKRFEEKDLAGWKWDSDHDIPDITI